MAFLNPATSTRVIIEDAKREKKDTTNKPTHVGDVSSSPFNSGGAMLYGSSARTLFLYFNAALCADASLSVTFSLYGCHFLKMLIFLLP